MTDRVVIIGTSHFAEVVHYYFRELDAYEVVGFAADRQYVTTPEFRGLPLVPLDEVDSRFPPATTRAFVAVGYAKLNKTRARLYAEIKARGYQLVSFVHPNVHLWPNNEVGENTFIFEDNTIQPFVKIGNDTILWSGNHVGHHSRIGDHCFITSHVVISGNCTIGDYCFIGVNATLRDGITIGNSVLIGAAAVIMKSANDKELFVVDRTRAGTRSTDDIEF